MIPDITDGCLPKAHILHRYIAKAIDFIIACALALILIPVGPVAGLLYILIADGFSHGKSVGKMLIGLKVVHEKDASRVAFKESIIRNIPFALAYIFFVIPFLGWFLFIIVGLPIIIFESYLIYHDESGLRVGDILAKTQVVDNR